MQDPSTKTSSHTKYQPFNITANKDTDGPSFGAFSAIFPLLSMYFWADFEHACSDFKEMLGIVLLCDGSP